MKAIILINKVYKDSKNDEKDVIIQAENVKKSLEKLGYKVNIIDFSDDLEIIKKIKKMKIDIVFNLVEDFDKNAGLLYIAPAILEHHGIKYTGCSSESIFLTTNKVYTKEVLKSNGIKTPDWITLKKLTMFNHGKYYIIKPCSEDASVDITDDSIKKIKNIEEAVEIIYNKEKKFNKTYFAEEYINGREFNISIIEEKKSAKVLPPAEIIFQNYTNDKFKIVNYNAKWEEESFEYQNTMRSFDFEKQDKKLIDDLKKIAKNCWNIFNLKGYARVDMRVDEKGNIYVIEINANPCISPDSGFCAACERDGISYTDMVSMIVKAVKQV